MTRTILVVLFALGTTPLVAGHHCQRVFVKHHAVAVAVVTPVVVQQVAPLAYYSTGAAVQERAVGVRIGQEAYTAFKAMLAADGQQTTAGAPVAALGVGKVAAAKCNACHAAKNIAPVGPDMDDTRYRDTMRRLMLPLEHPDHMPQKSNLEPQDLGDLIGELSGVPPEPPKQP